MKKKFFSAALAAAMVVTSVFSTTSVAGAAENETAVPYGKVTVEQKDNTVTIGNGAIERIFSTADKKFHVLPRRLQSFLPGELLNHGIYQFSLLP